MLLPMIGIFLDQPCPIAAKRQIRVADCPGVIYLHRNQAIIHQYFLGQEISPNCCLVTSAEFLVDLRMKHQFQYLVWCGKDRLIGANE